MSLALWRGAGVISALVLSLSGCDKEDKGQGPCVDHDNWSCGSTPPDSCPEICGPLREFDVNGCLRRYCSKDEDCGPGTRCYTPVDWDNDACGVTYYCYEENGSCTCDSNDDCEASYCIAAEDYPGD